MIMVSYTPAHTRTRCGLFSPERRYHMLLSYLYLPSCLVTYATHTPRTHSGNTHRPPERRWRCASVDGWFFLPTLVDHSGPPTTPPTRRSTRGDVARGDSHTHCWRVHHLHRCYYGFLGGRCCCSGRIDVIRCDSVVAATTCLRGGAIRRVPSCHRLAAYAPGRRCCSSAAAAPRGVVCSYSVTRCTVVTVAIIPACARFHPTALPCPHHQYHYTHGQTNHGIHHRQPLFYSAIRWCAFPTVIWDGAPHAPPPARTFRACIPAPLPSRRAADITRCGVHIILTATVRTHFSPFAPFVWVCGASRHHQQPTPSAPTPPAAAPPAPNAPRPPAAPPPLQPGLRVTVDVAAVRALRLRSTFATTTWPVAGHHEQLWSMVDYQTLPRPHTYLHA